MDEIIPVNERKRAQAAFIQVFPRSGGIPCGTLSGLSLKTACTICKKTGLLHKAQTRAGDNFPAAAEGGEWNCIPHFRGITD